MRCPECDATENRVVDTRSSRGGRAVRRRRECTVCGARFTTYEYIEERPVQVLKRSGAVEDFNRGKLLRSVKVACAKRPISASQMEALVDDIEDMLSAQVGIEILSLKLGTLVMERLSPSCIRAICFRIPELPRRGRVSRVCRRDHRGPGA